MTGSSWAQQDEDGDSDSRLGHCHYLQLGSAWLYDIMSHGPSRFLLSKVWLRGVIVGWVCMRRT